MSTLTEKTLIISCHSAGMGAILKSAVAGLLYAELTGRTPLIHWHTHCKYLSHSAQASANAFTSFYESTHTATLVECLKEANSTYPKNLKIETLPKLLKERQASFDEFETDEAKQTDVLLFPDRMPILEVIEHAPSGHFISDFNLESAAEWAVQNYIHIRPELAAKVQQFWEQNFPTGTPVVSVHIRGGDKYQEAILPHFSRYTDAADQFMKEHPNAKVFLASDSTLAVKHLTKHYKERLITTPAFRTSGRTGVHKSGQDGTKIGNEIIFDLLCLSRGDYFVGFQASNVYFWTSRLTPINKRLTAFSVTSGRKELFLNRHNFKRAIKQKWKRLFSK